MRRNSAVHASELTVMQRLRAAGLRPTMARIGLMQVVESAEAIPLPAHEVYRQLYLRGTPVSLGTVVRQLRELAQAGLLKHNGKKGHQSGYTQCGGAHLSTRAGQADSEAEDA